MSAEYDLIAGWGRWLGREGLKVPHRYKGPFSEEEWRSVVGNIGRDFSAQTDSWDQQTLNKMLPDLVPGWKSTGARRLAAASTARATPGTRLECTDPKSRPINEVLEFPWNISFEDIAALESGAIIKGLLRPGEAGTIYGPSGAGKSFVSLDMAWRIAMGEPWHNRKVKRRPVLYVILEGVGGFKKRMLAAVLEHGSPANYFARFKLPISLVRAEAGTKGVQEIVESFRKLLAVTGETTGVIIIDTLARAIAGDNENDTGDMTHFVEHRQGAIARETGAATLVVHHTNKQGTIRGNTANFGAQDLVIRVDRDDDKRTVVAEKVKDGVEGPLFDFELKSVPLGTDQDGDPIDSCIIKTPDPEPTVSARKQKKRTGPQLAFLGAFERVKLRGPNMPVCPETGEVLSAARAEDVKAAVMARKNKSSDANRQDWARVQRGLPEGYERRAIAGVDHFVDTSPQWAGFEPVTDVTNVTNVTTVTAVQSE